MKKFGKAILFVSGGICLIKLLNKYDNNTNNYYLTKYFKLEKKLNREVRERNRLLYEFNIHLNKIGENGYKFDKYGLYLLKKFNIVNQKCIQINQQMSEILIEAESK